MSFTAKQLNDQFGIGDALLFAEHSSGLLQGLINTQNCTGEFFLLGGHVSGFQPRGQSHPVLFMSAKSQFRLDKPIRGGVPICCPWFGPNKLDPQAPAHGVARLAGWNIFSTHQTADEVVVQMRVVLGPLHLEYSVSFGKTLDMSLTITNSSADRQDCEVALHTYFLLSEAESVQVLGLEQLDYIDTLIPRRVPASGRPITFFEETDRIYQGAVESISILDPLWQREILVRPRNSLSTVVWNPWIAKAKRMPDFGDEEYHTMCCVETANITPNQMSLAAGQKQSIAVEIAVIPKES